MAYELDVVEDGRRPPRPPSRGKGTRGRRILAALVIGSVVVAGAVSLHKDPAASRARIPVPVPSAAASPTNEATGEVRLLTDQYSYSTKGSSLSLQLSLVNYGSEAIQVLRSRLPQAGTRPVPGPGGDLPFSSPITLEPDRPTAVSVVARVVCPSVLAAPLADHVDVTLGRGGQPLRVESLSLLGLGSVLDDARHQACGATSASAAIYPTMRPSSVRVLAGAGRGQGTIESVLMIQDVGGTAAAVTVAGADPVGVTVERTDVSAGPIALTAGHTRSVLLRWRVFDCAALKAVRWPALVLTITVATSTATDTYGFDDVFGAQWRRALRTVCG